MKIYTIFLFLFFSLTIFRQSFATEPVYEQRRLDFIDTALTNFSKDVIILQAYKGLPVDQTTLSEILSSIKTNTVIDFQLVKLIRILFLSNGQYDSQILPALDSIPFWINKGDITRNFWSENHMIMWMSSDWLLYEKYNNPIDSELDKRLRHYLKLKVKYGFYEFFSSNYAPFTLSGLINLADFAKDTEIKQLATEACQLLLKEFLLITNNKGVFYPAAGRNYYDNYENPYGRNYSQLIYLMTGKGIPPKTATHTSPFLATSSIPMDTVIHSWIPKIDTTFSIGHSIDSGFVINSNLSPVDKTVFQWSSGAYFHPSVVLETAHLLQDSNMWDHVDFKKLSLFKLLTPPELLKLSKDWSSMSQSSVISGVDYSLFKSNAVTLSSVHDFWKGKLGYQAFPCVASVGTTAIMPASGAVFSDWNMRTRDNSNENFPYVKQKSNVSLLMYRPETLPALAGFKNPEVALHFFDNDFDEIRKYNNWLLGRQDEGYIGVRRACIGDINGVRGCYMDKGQTWVMVVGDSSMYGNFNGFENKIKQAQFTENWSYDTVTTISTYYAQVIFDTITIDYAWGVDSSLFVGINDKQNFSKKVNLFPNPTEENFTIDLKDFKRQKIELKVIHLLGHEVYSETINSVSQTQQTIHSENWIKGTYIVTIVGEKRKVNLKLIKQ